MTRSLYKSASRPQPIHLLCLWYEANDNWSAAHDLVDDKNDVVSSHLHAYLHRVEGDEWNAGYWYRKAGKPFPTVSTEEEWTELYELYG